MKLQYFDLLSPIPIFIKNIGTIRSPRLIEIRENIGYEKYNQFITYLSLTFDKYLELVNLKEEYDKLNDDAKKVNTFFNIMINHTECKEIFDEIFSFFICENVMFDKQYGMYFVWKDIKQDRVTDGEKHIVLIDDVYFVCQKDIENDEPIAIGYVIGYINSNNFNQVKSYLLQINHIDDSIISQTNVKSKKAKEILAKLQKGREFQNKDKKKEDTLDLPNMISKFCVKNNSGINILNVWDMTIYQFYDQFLQNSYIKQADIQDMIYANTVSFSDISVYDAQLWLKNIKQ